MRNYLIILTIIFALTSCNDFLVLEPENQINEINFYQTAQDFEVATLGSYTNLQGLHSTTLLRLAELTTDNALILWTSPSISEFEAEEVQFTSNNSFISAVWDNAFRTISRANNLLMQLEGANIKETLKQQYEGEAKFLRAYNYFILARFFGDLPLVTTAFRSPEEVNSFDWNRDPLNEVYDLIISDLTDAADLLDGMNEMNKSRASSGAAKTLLGKVYLTRQQFDQAEAVLKEVIDSDKYEMQEDYATLFTYNNENLPETIFEIPYLSGNVGEGNDFTGVFAPENFDMAIFPNNRPGSGRIVVTPDVANSYEAGDLRRAATIRDSLLLIDGSYDQVKYGVKFMDFQALEGGDGGINFTALRYADVLLMYAEALNEQGETEEALQYLNMVRERADLEPLSGLSQQEFRIAMEQERRVEFVQEAHRWFDLARTGRLQPVMNQYFEDQGLSFRVEDHEVLLPIPQDEIDINPSLEQNTGY